MLADRLEELVPELIQRVEAGATPSLSGRCGTDRISRLLGQLVASLRKQQVELPVCNSVRAIGVDVEPFFASVRLLKDAVYGAIEEHDLAATPREMRIIGDWFEAVTARALRAENRRFGAMLDALPDQMFLQDPQGRFVYLNRAMADMVSAMTGRRREDLIGFDAVASNHDAPFQRYIRQLRERVLGGEVIVAEQFRTPESAGAKWREHHVAPVYDSEGNVEAIAVASRDIHARKMAEAQAVRMQDELAQAVVFREQVMGMLGHDLRNPLSSVLALAEVLSRRQDVSERAREGLGRIKQAAERMNELIGTILDITQLRFRGGPQLDRSPVNLFTVARAIVDELRVAHPERTVELRASGDVSGRWDAGRIAQVLSNLVGNAITHGEGSPVRVLLAQESGGVVVEVTNGGPTIASEQLQHLFEPFWQAPRNGTGRRSGLGLGLFIVREIVRAHGGSIDVRSADGSTTFSVQLPRDEARVADEVALGA